MLFVQAVKVGVVAEARRIGGFGDGILLPEQLVDAGQPLEDHIFPQGDTHMFPEQMLQPEAAEIELIGQPGAAELLPKVGIDVVQHLVHQRGAGFTPLLRALQGGTGAAQPGKKAQQKCQRHQVQQVPQLH